MKIITTLQQTQVLFNTLQQTIKAKLQNAHSNTYVITTSQAKITNLEAELESLKVEMDAKSAKFALEMKTANVRDSIVT